MPTRQDWLLCFIVGTEGYASWVDRIRVMKGMFLFQEEGGAPSEVDYAFRPYDYGPFTPEVYHDLEDLEQRGSIAASRDAKSYRATGKGRIYLGTCDLESEAAERLRELRVEVCDLSFRDLLKRVYEAHPESAKRSIAKDVLE